MLFRELDIFFFRNLKLFVIDSAEQFFFSAEERKVVLLASLVDAPGRQTKQKYSSYNNILMKLITSEIVNRKPWLYWKFYLIFTEYYKSDLLKKLASHQESGTSS